MNSSIRSSPQPHKPCAKRSWIFTPSAIIFLVACFLIAKEHNYIKVTSLYPNNARQLLQATGALRTKQNLAWLLSYPFTGARVTIRIVQAVSNRSCATNYGQEVWTNWEENVKDKYDSVPVFESTPNGPFKQHYQLELPEADILTRTYCGGYCMDEGTPGCTLSDYAKYLANGELFLKACSSATKYQSIGDVTQSTQYDINRVKKAVVLIRNPLDVLISRFTDRSQFNTDFIPNNRGFVDWCVSYNSQTGTRYLLNSWYGDEIKSAAHGTLCHAELYRIAKWYNQAFKTMEVMNREIFVIKFEDYATKAEKVVDNLFSFLGLSKIENYEIPFHKADEDVYKWDWWLTSDQVLHMKNFFNTVADTRTSEEFEKYWPV